MDHVNLIIFDKCHHKNQDNGQILPRKYAVINDTIYLSNIASPVRNMMKLVIRKNKNSSRSLQLEDDSNLCPWKFELWTWCPEFDHIDDTNLPITIDRLKHSWVEKLRPDPNGSKNQKEDDKKRESRNFENVLQINFEDEANIFALHHDQYSS